MHDYQFHEIANIFPLIDGSDFDDLVADIRAHGVKEPVLLYENKILDGRNRYRAAQEAGKDVTTHEFHGTAQEAIEHVWSLNRMRRHLTPSQAAMADARRNKLMNVYAPVRAAAKERQREAVVERHKRKRDGVVKEQIPELEPQPQTRDIRAKAAGTNAKYIDLADKVIETRPDLAADVDSGKKTLSQVGREIRRNELAAKTPPTPRGKYRVIYADPPWKYNDALAITKNGLGESYGPAEAHYPPMTISELCSLQITELAEDNAVLFLWVTVPLLEDGLKVVNAWGFKYKTSFVWDKVKHNMGHYSSVRHEYLLVCTRGSCTPDNIKLFDSVQSIERKEHSRKPEEFRVIIDTLYTNGKKIELFRRGNAPDGWDVWGQEADE